MGGASSVRPSILKTLMGSAELWAKRSTCSRSQVGVVISAGKRILCTGYNGAPSGMKHCDHKCDCLHMRLFEDSGDPTRILPDDPHRDWCATKKPCEVAVHAEANAIAWAARHGISLDGAELFTTLSPCYKCAQLIIIAGIQTVYFGTEYRDTAGLELLASAGLLVIPCKYD